MTCGCDSLTHDEDHGGFCQGFSSGGSSVEGKQAFKVQMSFCASSCCALLKDVFTITQRERVRETCRQDCRCVTERSRSSCYPPHKQTHTSCFSISADGER